MKKLKYLLSCVFAGVLALLAIGCTKLVSYSVGLSSVETSANAKEQFGKTKIVNLSDSISFLTECSYEDNYISITWIVDSCCFHFALRNISAYTLKIDWDDISYVDYNGKVGRVMHSGVKYDERNSSQPSLLLPEGSLLSDALLPTENVGWSGSVWNIKALVPNSFNDVYGNAEAMASTYVGSTLSILMPIYIENVRNDYLFRFNVDSYHIKK